MSVNKSVAEIAREYENLKAMNESMHYYETVKRNRDFYNDRQWEGLNAPDLIKPVFNFLKPAVNYYVAMLISDDIAAEIQPFDEADAACARALGANIAQVLERENMLFKNRRLIRDCAVAGDCCLYCYYDADDRDSPYGGEIKTEVVDADRVYFGNAHESGVEEQPYIIVVSRKLLNEAREEAIKNGLDAEGIRADFQACAYDPPTCEVLLKMWKEDGCVRFIKCTRTALVQGETVTRQKRYPLAWMNWERDPGFYHGISPLTGKIQNQIFVNKLYAMAMVHAQNAAFPKIIYNRSLLEKWDPDPSVALGVCDPADSSILSAYRPPDMSAQAQPLTDSVIRYTKDMMGASDAALGTVNPDNTSAIIAVQKAAGMPLDIQRLDFYNFVESYIRIFIDLMRAYYGIREFSAQDSEGRTRRMRFDFKDAEHAQFSLNVEIGQSAYWSELAQIKTLDNLMDRGVIPDALTYLESLPEGTVKNRALITRRLKERLRTAEEAGEREERE